MFILFIINETKKTQEKRNEKKNHLLNMYFSVPIQIVVDAVKRLNIIRFYKYHKSRQSIYIEIFINFLLKMQFMCVTKCVRFERVKWNANLIRCTHTSICECVFTVFCLQFNKVNVTCCKSIFIDFIFLYVWQFFFFRVQITK